MPPERMKSEKQDRTRGLNVELPLCFRLLFSLRASFYFIPFHQRIQRKGPQQSHCYYRRTWFPGESRFDLFDQLARPSLSTAKRRSCPLQLFGYDQGVMGGLLTLDEVSSVSQMHVLVKESERWRLVEAEADRLRSLSSSS